MIPDTAFDTTLAEIETVETRPVLLVSQVIDAVDRTAKAVDEQIIAETQAWQGHEARSCADLHDLKSIMSLSSVSRRHSADLLQAAELVEQSAVQCEEELRLISTQVRTCLKAVRDRDPEQAARRAAQTVRLIALADQQIAARLDVAVCLRSLHAQFSQELPSIQAGYSRRLAE